MKAQEMIGMVALVLFSWGPVAARAQAYAVGADGQMQQEKQAPTIAPENQATTEQLSKLFRVMRIGNVQSMQSMAPSIVEQEIRSAMKQTEENLPTGTKLTPEQRQRMQEVIDKYKAKAGDLYAVDEMLADMRTIYQQHISKDDVEALIAFYSSPAGQRLLDAQPMIAQEFVPIVETKVIPRAEAMAKKMMMEMAAIAASTKSSGTKPAEAKQGSTTPKKE